MFYNKKFNSEFRLKFFKLFIKGFLVFSIFFILLSVHNKESIFGPAEYNEKATIEYLKKFCRGDITKIIVLTKGKYSKFEAVCIFFIKDKLLINEFKNIILKQDTIIKKNSNGQFSRNTHVTLYNDKNDKYSFCLNSEPYSGVRLQNEIGLTFFTNPSFDVSENYFSRPYDALNNNIASYGPISSDLVNYEIYYFLKKHIIDFTEENRSSTEGISGKCYITYKYK